jgi:hypothetical protein
MTAPQLQEKESELKAMHQRLIHEAKEREKIEALLEQQKHFAAVSFGAAPSARACARAVCGAHGRICGCVCVCVCVYGHGPSRGWEGRWIDSPVMQESAAEASARELELKKSLEAVRTNAAQELNDAKSPDSQKSSI